MEIRSFVLDEFRKRAAYERKERRWSQADIAKMLTAKGIDKMHHTTVAKIESGDREVKLDEAAAMADLFGLPLDLMMGRRQATREDEIAHDVRVLRDIARQSLADVRRTSTAVSNAVTDVMFDGIPADIEEIWSALQEEADYACQQLDRADDHLDEVQQLAGQLLDVVQQTRELPQ